MLFEWLGIKDTPTNPQEIVDLAIQTGRSTNSEINAD